ncbi:MAG: hypothetical protein NVS4B11_35540 [Ktedonobacteraceae bacterium]
MSISGPWPTRRSTTNEDHGVLYENRYEIYTLKTEKLALPEKVSLETITEAVEQNSLVMAKLVGTFTKVKTK